MKVYSLNEHEFIHDNVEIKEKKHGLSKQIKKLIELVITLHDIHSPKRILIKLTRM